MPTRYDLSQENGLSAALTLVQSIYDQVTLNDSPPVNDEIARFLQQQQLSLQQLQNNTKNQRKPQTASSRKSSKPTDLITDFNRQRHVISLPPDVFSTPSTTPTHATSTEETSLIENMRDLKMYATEQSPKPNSPLGTDCLTTVSSNSIPLEISPRVQQVVSMNHSTHGVPRVDKMRSLVRKAEYSMGNMSLAALCVRALNTAEQPIKGEILAMDPRELPQGDENLQNKSMEDSIRSEQMSDIITNVVQTKNVMEKEREVVVAELDFLFKSSFLSEEKMDEETSSHVAKNPTLLSPDAKSTKSDFGNDVYGLSSPLSDDGDTLGENNIHDIPVFQPALEAAKVAEEAVATHSTNSSSRKGALHKRGNLPPLSPTQNMENSPFSKETSTKVPSHHRLQMYGSEYARHISKLSHFSPPPSTMKMNRVPVPRRPKSSHDSLPSQRPGGTPPRFPLDIPSDHGHIPLPPSTVRSSSSRPESISSFESSDVSTQNCWNIEDADDDILSGAITDIIVTHGLEPPPKGYYRISKTSNGYDLDDVRKSSIGGMSSLVNSKKNANVWINVRKEPNWEKAIQRPCVTALAVIFPDRNEFVPPGFSVVRRYKASTAGNIVGDKDNRDSSKMDRDGEGAQAPANLNHGTSGERVFLCYRRSREGNPITGLLPLFPSNNETVPEGYTVIEKTPRNFVADINHKAGPSIFLAIRQRLANLETLRPLPLVLSICYSNWDDVTDASLSSYRKTALKAYYCTGGTIVSSDVGRYHIMDRSTHMMLSSSSVRSRLSVIEASRLKRSSSSIASGTTASLKPYESSLRLSGRDDEPMGDKGNFDDVNELSVNSKMSKVPPTTDRIELNLSSNSDSFGDAENDGLPFIVSPASESRTCNDSFSFIQTPMSIGEKSSQDRLLHACYDAMSFIPSIDCANQSEDDRFPSNLLQARISVLTPILTACYTLHGGSALIAIEGLTSLLKKTNFFLPDVENDIMICDRLTLLELAIQVVCDVGNSTSRETHFSSCVEFVNDAVEYSKGNLNHRTLGYVIRFYLFVFYFGASIPNSSSWPQVTSKREGDETKDVIILSKEDVVHTSGRPTYFPGGAPQLSALALKQLISLFIGRMNKLHFNAPPQNERIGLEASNESDLAKTALDSITDSSMELVNIADFTQLALHQILKSGGSELFWHDMISTCGTGLFGSIKVKDPTINSFFVSLFSMLSTIVKAMSGSIRRIGDSALFVPRDVAGKFLSLELLEHFLETLHENVSLNFEFTGDGMKKTIKTGNSDQPKIDSKPFETMVYAIRRLVVPTLLENTKDGIQDVRVFRRMMKIVSELWCRPFYREHIKVEIGVLIEHFFLKILRLGPQLLPPKRLFQASQSSALNELSTSLLPQQVVILTEVKLWFSNEPRNILELYLNFDEVDSAPNQNNFRTFPTPHWCVTEQLCSSICTLSEQCTEIVSEQIRLTRVDLACMDSATGAKNIGATVTQDDWREMTTVREGARYLQEKCFEAIGQMVRSLMLCSAAATGANYDLLVTLRERRLKHSRKREVAVSNSNDAMPEVIGLNFVSSEDMDDEGGPGKITIQSISTLGNIVGGIQSKRELIPNSSPGSPTKGSRTFSPAPSPSRSSANENGIAEYWHSSIARERRKFINFSPTHDKLRQMNQDQHSSGAFGLVSPKGRGPSVGSILPMSPTGGASTGLQDFRSYFVSSLYDADKTLDVDKEKEILSHHQKIDDMLETAFDIMESKSLKKALDYLFACNFLTHSPRDIASFLRLYQTKIDPESLGDYLGEGGRDGAEIEHLKLIRFYYTRAISFVNMSVEQGLRHFLTNCGFRLPGEAQKIDRIMTTFSQCYWEDNAGDLSRCPFQDEDTVFLISFAIIMLNTDLHKTSSYSVNVDARSIIKQKPRKKMTKTEFLNNLRGIDGSIDPARDHLSNIYDNIEAYPIQMNDFSKQNRTDRSVLTLQYGGDVRINVDCSHSDLSDVIVDIYRNSKVAQELLRGLAVHEHPYLTLKNYRKKVKAKRSSIPGDLVSSAFSAVWHHFYSVINSVLQSAHLNPKGLENCLDVLKYSLCSSICLDAIVERNAFAVQLVRVKCFRENRGLNEDEQAMDWARDQLDYKKDPWFQRIVNMDGSNVDTKVSALDEVDDMFYKLHASLKVDTKLKKEMFRVVHQIRNGQILLNDPTRYFIKQSDLAKKSNRSGRYNKYTFFLFSDLLVYAHMSSTGDFKIHEELPLHLMKIVDVKSTGISNHQKNIRSFHIIHPRKSFVVTASSPEDKSEWIQAINLAINREIIRKARIEGARQAAAFDR